MRRIFLFGLVFFSRVADELIENELLLNKVPCLLTEAKGKKCIAANYCATLNFPVAGF